MVNKYVLAAMTTLALAGAVEATTTLEKSKKPGKGTISHEIYGNNSWFQRHFCRLTDILFEDGVKHHSIPEEEREKAIEDIKDVLKDAKYEIFLEGLREVGYRYKPRKGGLSGIERLIITGKATEEFKGKHYAIDWRITFEVDGEGDVLDTMIRLYPKGGLGSFMMCIPGVRWGVIKAKGMKKISEIEAKEVGEMYPVDKKSDDPEIIRLNNNIIYRYLLKMIREVEKS